MGNESEFECGECAPDRDETAMLCMCADHDVTQQQADGAEPAR